MNTNELSTEPFDEQQSMQVIREMIHVSQKKLKNDGILFIMWGWIMFYVYAASYFLLQRVTTFQLRRVLEYTGYVLAIAGLVYTVIYIIRHLKKVKTFIGVSLRYLWISMIVCLVLINLIQFNVLHQINFELQHPIFMVVIAFTIVVTGGILRYRLIIVGGIIFGALAYICSYIPIQEQMLVEALAWLAAFVIPGHIMFSKRKS